MGSNERTKCFPSIAKDKDLDPSRADRRDMKISGRVRQEQDTRERRRAEADSDRNLRKVGTDVVRAQPHIQPREGWK